MVGVLTAINTPDQSGPGNNGKKTCSTVLSVSELGPHQRIQFSILSRSPLGEFVVFHLRIGECSQSTWLHIFANYLKS